MVRSGQVLLAAADHVNLVDRDWLRESDGGLQCRRVSLPLHNSVSCGLLIWQGRLERTFDGALGRGEARIRF